MFGYYVAMYPKLIQMYEFLKIYGGTITQEIEPGRTIVMKLLDESDGEEVEEIKRVEIDEVK